MTEVNLGPLMAAQHYYMYVIDPKTNGLMVAVHTDGRVDYGPDYNADEAWGIVAKYVSEAFKIPDG